MKKLFTLLIACFIFLQTGYLQTACLDLNSPSATSLTVNFTATQNFVSVDVLQVNFRLLWDQSLGMDAYQSATGGTTINCAPTGGVGTEGGNFFQDFSFFSFPNPVTLNLSTGASLVASNITVKAGLAGDFNITNEEIVDVGASNLFQASGTCNTTVSFTLPVELVTFSAVKEDSKSLIKWSTASELNNDYFEIQRSSNGANYLTIGQVNGFGTTTTPQDYSFLDPTPFPGNNYYRLKQVDFDGAFEYSNVEVLNFDQDQTMALVVFPNPASDQLNIQLPVVDSKNNCSFELLNTMGQTVKKVYYDGGTSRYVLDVSEVGPGAYFLTAESDGLKYQQSIIITK